MDKKHTVHQLKTIQPHFDDVLWGRKTFEIRKNDRNFKVGDYLILEKYNQETKQYEHGQVVVEITHILKDYPAIDKDYVVLSIKPSSTH